MLQSEMRTRRARVLRQLQRRFEQLELQLEQLEQLELHLEQLKLGSFQVELARNPERQSDRVCGWVPDPLAVSNLELELERERELERRRRDARRLIRRLRKQLARLKDVITRDVLLTKNLHSLLLAMLLFALFLELFGWFIMIGLFTTLLVYILLIIHPTLSVKNLKAGADFAISKDSK